ncbi:MAG: M48 family metallopeptidase [Hyphomicrobiales bacterium]
MVSELAKFPGVFFDGLSPVERAVTITLAAYGLSIRYDDETAEHSWSYAGLSSVEPARSRKTVRLYHRSMQGARLRCDHIRFADCVVQHAPHLTKSAEHKRTAKLVALIIVGLVVLITGTGVFMTYAPRYLATFIPEPAWDALGRSVIAQMIDDKKVCDSKPGEDALLRLTKRLTATGQFAHPPSVKVYALPIVNAFATTGGQIVISSKLIEHNKTPDELAGVLAHELAHAQLRHPEKAMVRAMGLQAILTLLTGGSSGAGEVATNMVGLAAILRYSRAAELEADALAQSYLNDANINPEGLSSFIRSVQNIDAKGNRKKQPDTSSNSEKDESSRNLLDFLSTHPNLEERIRQIKPNPDIEYESALTAREWLALRKICGDAANGGDKAPSEKETETPVKDNDSSQTKEI